MCIGGVLLVLIIIAVGTNSNGLLNNLLVTPNDDTVIVTTNNNSLIILSSSLQETTDCSDYDIINGGVAVDDVTGNVVVCLLNSSCMVLNTTDCVTNNINNLSLNSTNSSILSLYSNNETIYIVTNDADSIPDSYIQIVKYDNSEYVWDTFIESDSKRHYLALLVVDNLLYMILTDNYNHDLVVIRITDEVDTPIIDYEVKVLEQDVAMTTIYTSFIEYNGDTIVLIAYSGFVNTVSLSLLNEYCHEVNTANVLYYQYSQLIL